MNEQHHIDTDLDPENIASIDDLPEDERPSVGALLSPSDIRAADVLGQIASNVWLYGRGEEVTELRRCPKSLERVARARARGLRRETEGDDDE